MATSYQYDPIGASNGLFAPALIRGDPVSEQAVRDWEAAHLKKPPAYDPWYTPPPPPPVPGLSPDASTQRDRIAMQMVQGSGPGGGGDVAGNIGPTPGFTTLGKGDPDNPTVAPTQAPPQAPPDAPPQESVEQGPATPTGVVTSAPMPDVNNPLGQQFGPPAPTTAPKGDLADKDQTQFQSPPEQSQMQNTPFGVPTTVQTVAVTPTDPTPPQKGEPTAEEDAAELASVNAQAVQEGYMSPEGVPGKGVTTTSTPMSQVAPAPPAPPAPPAAPTTADSLAAQAAQQAQANLAAAIAEANTPSTTTTTGPVGPTSVAPSPSSLGLNAPIGVPGVDTGLQHGYFGDPNQTSTLGQVTAALANQAPNEMATSVTDAQSLANAISMGLTAADAETAADPGIASGISGETADSGIGLSGIGFGDTGTATGAEGDVGGVSVGGFGPGVGLSGGDSVGPTGSVSAGDAAAAEAGSVGTEGSASADGGSGIGDGVGGGGIGW